jgi:hypothetical protein
VWGSEFNPQYQKKKKQPAKVSSEVAVPLCIPIGSEFPALLYPHQRLVWSGLWIWVVLIGGQWKLTLYLLMFLCCDAAGGT